MDDIKKKLCGRLEYIKHHDTDNSMLLVKIKIGN